MKLKRSTQGLLIAALVLGTGIAVYEGTIAPEQRAQQAQGDRLFQFASTDVQQITIETSAQETSETLQFERLETPIQIAIDNIDNEESFTATDWQFVRLDDAPATETNEADAQKADTADGLDQKDEMSESEESETPETASETDNPNEAPNEDRSTEDLEDPSDTDSSTLDPTDPEPDRDEPIPARQAYMDYLFGELERITSDRTLSAPANRRAEYGLATPVVTLTIELKDGTQHTLAIGNRDFSQAFVYGLIDTPPDADKLDVLLLPPDLTNAFDRDLDEWDATVSIEEINSDISLPDPSLPDSSVPDPSLPTPEIERPKPEPADDLAPEVLD